MSTSAVPPIKTTAVADYSEVHQGLELSVDDLIETRHGGERMLISPQKFKQLIDGRKKTPRWRRLLRWLKKI